MRIGVPMRIVLFTVQEFHLHPPGLMLVIKLTCSDAELLKSILEVMGIKLLKFRD